MTACGRAFPHPRHAGGVDGSPVSCPGADNPGCPPHPTTGKGCQLPGDHEIHRRGGDAWALPDDHPVPGEGFPDDAFIP